MGIGADFFCSRSSREMRIPAGLEPSSGAPTVSTALPGGFPSEESLWWPRWCPKGPESAPLAEGPALTGRFPPLSDITDTANQKL